MPYTLNGQNVSLNNEPRNQNGTMWVPLREVGEALGGKVDWEPTNDIALVYLDDHMATIEAGDAKVRIDGQEHTLQAAPFEEQGETWVPVRLFESLGYGLVVDIANNSVSLNK